MTQTPSQLHDVSQERLKEDARTLRRTIARLGRPYLIRRVIIAVVGVVVFLLLANAILGFGEGVSYERLGTPESPVVSFLTRINMYIWWALVAILGLITFFWLKASWQDGVERERAVPVPSAEVRALADNLSAPVLDVMRWVWDDHRDPLTLGDLQRTLAETRSGRIDKIRIAVEQQAVLGAHKPI